MKSYSKISTTFLVLISICCLLENCAFASLPNSFLIPFIENSGQVKDKNVLYYVKTSSGTIFVMKNGEIDYSFHKAPQGILIREQCTEPLPSEVKGEEIALPKVNYFIGNNPDNMLM